MNHYLKANATTRTPTHHAVFDTETYRDLPEGPGGHEFHRLRFGHAISWRCEKGRQTRRRTISFVDCQHFWSNLVAEMDERRPLWLWAHNLGFDFTVSDGWDILTNYGFRCRNPVIDDPPTILHWIKGKLHLVCVDSMNWFRCPLAELGESVGLQKLLFPGFLCEDDDLATYCVRDTEILERAVLSLASFVRFHDLGVMQKTAPAQALQCYRHRFAPKLTSVEKTTSPTGLVTEKQVTVCLPAPHGQSKALKLERESYYGGECAAYYVGRITTLVESIGRQSGGAIPDRARAEYGPCHVLDHTGFYSSQMAGNLFPSKLRSILGRATVPDLARLARKWGLVASVLIVSENDPYPVRLDGRTAHAVGQFWTVLAGPELVHAIERDRIGAVGKVCTYDLAELFTPYVEYFWQMRRSFEKGGNHVGAALAKLMLNSLYGKFGQKSARWKDTPRVPAEKDWGEWPVFTVGQKETLFCRAIAGCVQSRCEDRGAGQSFPAVASYVTSYGRLRMRRLRELCGTRNVYYQGDDSLHVSQAGFDALWSAGEIEPQTPGKLRLVSSHQTAEYRGVRDYALDGKTTLAGVAAPDENRVEGGYKVTEFERLNSVCSEKPKAGIVVRHLIRASQPPVPTGGFGPDGWVKPLRLGPGDSD